MKFKKDGTEDILSILGEGFEFQGELAFPHGVRVDGIVRGKIRSESCLIIGPKGRVEADVAIRRITINGEFHGTIHASDRVEIHRAGKVFGDLYTPCLIIEAGATFEGKCNMHDASAVPLATMPHARAAGEKHD